MSVCVRFAPSPTGRLHAGHAYSALLNARFAGRRGGRMLLRIEDIDASRCREAFTAGILDDLAWLAIDWEQPVRHQSAHMADYAGALARLKDAGLLYPCFCTRAAIAEELAQAGVAPQGAGAPVYPGTCRRLEPGQQAERLGTGAPHAMRLDVAAAQAMTGRLSWVDSLAGPVVADPLALGDVVLARKEMPTSYHLAVTLDDALQGVTDVIRGVDLFAATHVHRLLQALLALPTPRYHHHPLLVDAAGERLAKRRGSAALADLRAAGMTADRLTADWGLDIFDAR